MGKPIKGQTTMSGKRICWLDKAIRAKTGLNSTPTEDEKPTQPEKPTSILPEKKVSPNGDTPKSVGTKDKE
jgi:hypothetical protein